MELPEASSGRSALEIAIRAARAAGAVSREQFGGTIQIDYKGRSNIVTNVDRLAEKTILDILHKEFPTHGFLAEESGKTGTDSPYIWIIDPLDGTNNYSFGVPFFSVSIALVADNDFLLGVVFDPLRDDLFYAAKGNGAWLNRKSIHVSEEKRLSHSFVGSDIGYDAAEGRRMLETVAMLWPKTHGVRIMGSAVLGLAYVACGKMSLYVHRNLFPWDLAAATLLVREAGGVVTDWQGNDVGLAIKDVVAANKAIGQEFIGLMSGSEIIRESPSI